MENPGLYEGDMLLDPDQMKEVEQGTFTFSATGNKNKLWPNAVVPYVLSSDLSRNSGFMKEFKHSIDQYHKYTCLRFKQRTNERGYIYFYQGGGCSSPVGYTGGRNTVSLSKGCWWRSTIMHEIGHSLGFHHEQSRPDRDNHVTILFQNVARGTEHNFKKQSYSNTDSRGTPYDYRSMMHYSFDAFGSGRMTIKTKDPLMQYEIGNGQGDRGFSNIDIIQLQRMYSCRGNYPKVPEHPLPTRDCYDKRGCAKGHSEGNCNKREWQTYMKGHCRMTCGFCKAGPVPSQGPIPTQGPNPNTPRPTPPRPTSGGNCRDRVIDCHRLGRHRCTDSNSAWRNYMHRSCRRYCSLC